MAKRWEHSFQAYDSFRTRSVPTDTGTNQCHRAELCSSATITREPDGMITRHPASTPRAYCDPCEQRIGRDLSELPSAFGRLSLAIGDRPATGQQVRTPFGPRLLLRADVDALQREMALVLVSWHERVAAVAHLSPPEFAPHALAPMVDAAVTALSAHLGPLLALAAEPMARVMPPAAAEAWEDEVGMVRADAMAHMLIPLSGADAGMEILTLHQRSRRILGETRAQPERFDGVPCRECEAMGLERAEPPSDPDKPAMHSRCPQCGDTMDRGEYLDWVKRYEAWAKGAGLPSCRRCQRGDHEGCAWKACNCRASGHAVMAAVA